MNVKKFQTVALSSLGIAEKIFWGSRHMSHQNLPNPPDLVILYFSFEYYYFLKTNVFLFFSFFPRNEKCFCFYLFNLQSLKTQRDQKKETLRKGLG